MGFAQIDGKLYGSRQQYVNLSLLLISNEYRYKGIGRMLFTAACEKAISTKAEKLYISAHSSVDVIIFYRKMGCTNASEIIQELIDDINDWQMEYQLYQSEVY